MNINFASSEHAEQIAALHAASWAATYSDVLSAFYFERVVPTERLAIWQERFEDPKVNQFTLVAKEAGGVVAFACAFVGEHSDWGSYLDNLHVKQSHQGRGVVWTEEAERWLRDIHEYIAADNPVSAVKVVAGIFERAQGYCAVSQRSAISIAMNPKGKSEFCFTGTIALLNCYVHRGQLRC